MEIRLQLNARFQPKHRFDLEDAIDEILQNNKLGEVTGGGTLLNKDGEIKYCDINIQLNTDDLKYVQWLVEMLNGFCIPKGSFLEYDNEKIHVGTLEGLACYLNGKDLPAEVYQTCDINYVIEQMTLAMNETGRMYSYWEGPIYTALYFYGSSFNEMKKKTESFINTYPLCQKCRVVQIS